MTPPLSYLQFHVVFILPPLFLLLGFALYQRDAWLDRDSTTGLAVILFLALVYTTPWDNLLILEGVWWYGEGTTAMTIWAAPIGEYLFFVLQPILTALFLYQLPIPSETPVDVRPWHRLAGVAAGLAISVVGLAMLFGPARWFYLGAILVWAGPIFAIQWGFGITYLLHAWRPVALAIAAPTAYLWIADWTAITLGIWVISDVHTIGVAPFGLPIEEMTFFLVTNIFVVQGLVLYRWLVDAWPHPVADFMPKRFRSSAPQGQ